MRILIPILGFGRAGGHRVLSELASAWVRAGHQVDFLVPSTSEDPYFPTSARLLWATREGNIASAPPALRGNASGVDNQLSLLRALRAMKDPADVVLANHSLTAWPVWLSGAGARAFYYIQAYEPEYYWMERQPVKWLLSRLSYALPLKQIVNSPTYAGYGPIATDAVVPFGIDLAIFHPVAGETRRLCHADEIVLGCIGRSEPSKGTPYILSAFEQLWAHDRRFRLKVAYGNLPRDWSHPAAEVVVPANDRELANFYRSLDILVAAGVVQHGAPHYPVLEAMACGVPVVNTGYMPATPDNSWIVASRDSAAICEGVAAVVSGADVGERRRRAFEAVQPFAWDAVAERMVAIFERTS